MALRWQHRPVQGSLYTACDCCSHSTGLQRLDCSCTPMLLYQGCYLCSKCNEVAPLWAICIGLNATVNSDTVPGRMMSLTL